MWMLELLDLIFNINSGNERERARRENFCRSFYEKNLINSNKATEVISFIESKKIILHNKNISVDEAFNWIYLPQLLSEKPYLSEEEIQKAREQFKDRLESKKFLNSFGDSLPLKYNAPFWMFLTFLAVLGIGYYISISF
jgi:hypothetical protein